VFLSYRRDDVQGQTGRLFDRLSEHFGEDLVFMDVESLTPGEHFDVAIEGAIAQCDVVLVLIGRRWLADPARLADPGDFLRREVRTALKLARPMVPLLVDGAALPLESQLPDDMKALVRGQAFELRHATFARDAAELIADLERQHRPAPAAACRRRLARELGLAGAPCAWFARLVRVAGPAGAFAVAALLVAVLAAGIGWAAHLRGWSGGAAAGEAAKQAAVVQKAIEVTEQYERIAATQRKAALTWRGFVTDGARGLPDAAVTFTNTASRRTASAETGQFGQYVINLETLGVSDDTILEVAVALPSYRPSRDTIRFKDGIELRTFMKPR
jgi:hypothetical protein